MRLRSGRRNRLARATKAVAVLGRLAWGLAPPVFNADQALPFQPRIRQRLLQCWVYRLVPIAVPVAANVMLDGWASKSRQSEIEPIITQARKAAAAAGTAVFTQDFKNEAKTLNDQATGGSKFTAGLGFATPVFAMAVWLFPVNGDDAAAIIQHFGGKLVTLIALFTATLCCGRTIKALKHRSTIDRHRAPSLQTVQAFAHSASADTTKAAVFMAAICAILGGAPIGFLDGKGGPQPDFKIIEIAKSLGGKGGGSRCARQKKSTIRSIDPLAAGRHLGYKSRAQMPVHCDGPIGSNVRRHLLITAPCQTITIQT